MSDAARAALLALGLSLGLSLSAAPPARAEPAVTILDLPFRVTAMRGPASEVAVAVATSGLLPLARPKAGDPAPEAGEEERAPVVVVWGEGGGAALALGDGAIRTTLLGAEAIEGLAAAETPRGALPGSRRALSGALSAYLTGPTRAGGVPGAAGLTIRERQPMAVSAEPKPVPITTVTVAPGPDAVFAAARPRSLRLAGRPAFLAATLSGTAGGLALIGRRDGGPADWTVLARSPAVAGGPPKIAAVAPFTAAGLTQAATVRGDGLLQVWTLAPDALSPAAEAPGYAAGPVEVDLAAAVETERDGPADLALPAGDGAALALVSLDGRTREVFRATLPAPAATGIAALGRGPGALILVGLADGRVAVVSQAGAKP